MLAYRGIIIIDGPIAMIRRRLVKGLRGKLKSAGNDVFVQTRKGYVHRLIFLIEIVTEIVKCDSTLLAAVKTYVRLEWRLQRHIVHFL